jgi:hypothetical protein
MERRLRATRRGGSRVRAGWPRGSADNLGRFHNSRLADDLGADRYIAAEWSEAKVALRMAVTYDAANMEI